MLKTLSSRLAIQIQTELVVIGVLISTFVLYKVHVGIIQLCWLYGCNPCTEHLFDLNVPSNRIWWSGHPSFVMEVHWRNTCCAFTTALVTAWYWCISFSLLERAQGFFSVVLCFLLQYFFKIKILSTHPVNFLLKD